MLAPTIDIKNPRFSFFDKGNARRAIKEFRKEFAGFAGGLVRREARQSIRKAVVDRKRTRESGGYRYYKEQPPDQPPRWRRNKDFGIRQIVYAWDEQRGSVVVGPMKYLGSASAVPAALEGTKRVSVRRTRRRLLRIGSGAAIRVGGSVKRRSRRTTKVIGTDTPKGFETVTFIKIRTINQLLRADEIQNRLFKPVVSYFIQPRPYMRPALGRLVYGEMVRGQKRTLKSLWQKRAAKAWRPRRRKAGQR